MGAPWAAWGVVLWSDGKRERMMTSWPAASKAVTMERPRVGEVPPATATRTMLLGMLCAWDHTNLCCHSSGYTRHYFCHPPPKLCSDVRHLAPFLVRFDLAFNRSCLESHVRVFPISSPSAKGFAIDYITRLLIGARIKPFAVFQRDRHETVSTTS